MSVIKVIEVLANSTESWEDATKMAVKEASKTVKNIKSVYIKEQSCVVDGENITHYRINAKISFQVE